jgi:hypothetical protein
MEGEGAAVTPVSAGGAAAVGEREGAEGEGRAGDEHGAQGEGGSVAAAADLAAPGGDDVRHGHGRGGGRGLGQGIETVAEALFPDSGGLLVHFVPPGAIGAARYAAGEGLADAASAVSPSGAGESRASRNWARALEVWLLTVPVEQPRICAVCSTE